MYADPCIPEALSMFERMTSKHTRDLASSELKWFEVKDKTGELLQLVPLAILEFKWSRL